MYVASARLGYVREDIAKRSLMNSSKREPSTKSDITRGSVVVAEEFVDLVREVPASRV